MTLTVLAIAAAHAVPVIWAANRWGTRTSVTVVALMACIAGAIGKSKYSGVDLFFVVAAYALYFQSLEPFSLRLSGKKSDANTKNHE
ncbi:hypothetical protein [Cupriavidus necator]|uniref:hypothetical protein n=1 Tax=Cupriavidus necator TaxID=106590 RepID=UPI0005B3A69E|nr:hypothetical protein [Cupriavidus necator]